LGYSTDFEGRFSITPALRPEHAAYLARFCTTRRMKRDEGITARFPDPEREAVGLPVGVEGGFYVGSAGLAQETRNSAKDWRNFGVLDPSQPPKGQPSLCCQWIPNQAGTALEWDQIEKFYGYQEWLQYLIDSFLQPWRYTVAGRVTWQGEDEDDFGILEVANHVVRAEFGHTRPSPEMPPADTMTRSDPSLIARIFGRWKRRKP